MGVFVIILYFLLANFSLIIWEILIISIFISDRGCPDFQQPRHSNLSQGHSLVSIIHSHHTYVRQPQSWIAHRIQQEMRPLELWFFGVSKLNDRNLRQSIANPAAWREATWSRREGGPQTKRSSSEGWIKKQRGSRGEGGERSGIGGGEEWRSGGGRGSWFGERFRIKSFVFHKLYTS